MPRRKRDPDGGLGPTANLKTPWRMPGECRCGHDATLHVQLPGHPDGAQECYGSDDCQCGRYRP